jgi:hypothetical protein
LVPFGEYAHHAVRHSLAIEASLHIAQMRAMATRIDLTRVRPGNARSTVRCSNRSMRAH